MITARPFSRAKRVAVTALMGLVATLTVLPVTAAPATAAPLTHVTISGGHGNYLLEYAASRTDVEDPTNFGPAGIVTLDNPISLKTFTTDLTPAYLSDVDIMYDGWVSDGDWDAGELDAMLDWIDDGGVAIVTEDADSADELSTALGAPVTSRCCDIGTMSPLLADHPIVDGPFGAWTEIQNLGTVGHFGTSLPAEWTPVAQDEFGNIAIAVRDWGDGHVILLGDEAIFRHNQVVGGNLTAVLNIIAYAISQTDDGVIPLSVSDPGDQATRANTPVTLPIVTNDGDGSDVSFAAADLPVGLDIDTATGVITGVPTAAGTDTVTVTATPVTGTAAQVTFSWEIATDLVPQPVDDDIDGLVGDTISVDLCANDVGGDPATTIAPVGALPTGWELDDCELQATPTVAGQATFDYIATDDDGDTDTATVSIDIGRAPCSPASPLSFAGGVPGRADAGDAFGTALAAGDFDGDGHQELAIGAPGDLRAKGSVTIFSSPCDEPVAHRVTQQGALPSRHEADDRFGAALAAGDFDGDGYDDLAIGIPGEDFRVTVDAGAVIVMYGGPTGLTDSGARLLSQRGATPGKAQSDDRFGEALAAGDFDGDGRDDLLVGSPGEDVAGKADAGAFYVFDGSAAGLRPAAAQVFRQRGRLADRSDKGDRLGLVVAAGDLDGDGRDEAIVAAPYEDGDAVNSGIVHVLWGSASGVRTAGQDVVIGDGARDRLGVALTVGDVTADGTSELLVGAAGANGAGHVEVFSVAGRQPSLLAGVQQSSPGSGERFGASIAVGDIDRDGLAEVVVGIPGQAANGQARAGTVELLSWDGSTLRVDGPVQSAGVDRAPGTAETRANLGAVVLIVGDVVVAGSPGALGTAGSAVAIRLR